MLSNQTEVGLHYYKESDPRVFLLTEELHPRPSIDQDVFLGELRKALTRCLMGSESLRTTSTGLTKVMLKS